MRLSLKHWLRRRREPWTAVFYEAFKRWKRDRMELRRVQFPSLGSTSVVFDFGGFEGNWTAMIRDRYGASVQVFEPHPTFARQLQKRFAGDAAVTVHPFALGAHWGILHLSDDGDASSSFRSGTGGIRGEVRSVADFFADHPQDRLDVVKVNIEGGEYDLLPALIDSGVIDRIGVLQVQFHLFDPDDIGRRQQIRGMLARTHDCDLSYDFVWEQWSLRS
jgi:FkbM family methyltransferase